MASKLDRGFRLALERVTEIPACGALFTELDLTGDRALRASVYGRAAGHLAARKCGRASALTAVGRPVVLLCPSFAHLAEAPAAARLIHEALHVAGLGEWPLDPQAQRSREINAVVTAQCDL